MKTFDVRWHRAKGQPLAYKRVKAKNHAEAESQRRQLEREELLVGGGVSDISFEDAKIVLEKSLYQKSNKTVGKFLNTYHRIFFDYLPTRHDFSQKITQPKDLNIYGGQFFQHYRIDFESHVNPAWPSDLRNELVNIRWIIKKFAFLGFCSADVLLKIQAITLPKKKRRAPVYLEGREWHAIIDAVRDDRPVYYPFVNFMFRTGRRPGEISNYRIRDIDIVDGKIIRFDIPDTITKNKETDDLSWLELVRDKEFIQMLVLTYQRSKKIGSEFLFSNEFGRPINDTTLRHVLQDAAFKVLGDREKADKVTAVQYRKRVATQNESKGIPRKAGMAITGHKDEQVYTQTYAARIKKDIARAFETTK